MGMFIITNFNFMTPRTSPDATISTAAHELANANPTLGTDLRKEKIRTFLHAAHLEGCKKITDETRKILKASVNSDDASEIKFFLKTKDGEQLNDEDIAKLQQETGDGCIA